MDSSPPPLSGQVQERHRQRLAGLVEVPDAQQRLAALLQEARAWPSLPPALRLESNRVEGCLVRIWFVPEFREEKCSFHCDSDAVSLKAVGGLLCQLYSGLSPAEILAVPRGVLKPLGILHQLAENRQRTLARIEEKIHHFARERVTGSS